MSALNALVLGIVQGLTEFLPVSSTGHLILVPRLFGWDEQPLAFDVALHAGTLLALGIYFRRDWWTLARETFCDVRRAGLDLRAWGPYGRLALLLGAGTVPALVAGVALTGVEDRLRTPGVVAAMLVVVGLAMASVEWWSGRPGRRPSERLTLNRVGIMGVAQACALVPGVSRSGATIAAGMVAGLDRATAARFSFLLAMPVTLAAAVKELPALPDSPAVDGLAIAIGVGTSFACGLLAIAFLLRYLARHRLYVFVAYRVGLAAIVLALL